MKFKMITPSKPIDNPELFHSFALRDVKSAVLRITGLGLYRAFINGRRVGSDYLTPGYNDYDAYLRYQVYDVTDMLKDENEIRVFLGNGWYKGVFFFSARLTNLFGSTYCLAAEMTVTHTDGTVETLCVDDTWQARESVFGDNSIYDGEVRDDTKVIGTPVPCVYCDNNYDFVEQFSPCIRRRAEFKPVLINTPKGEQVLDFGQNMAGVFKFINRAPKGTTVHIQVGEVMQEGCFYRDNLRSAKAEFFYTSDGTVKEIEPFFTFYGFRYIMVEGIKVDPADFTAIALSSDLQVPLKASTQNPLINQLMSNCFWGQLSNFVDVPTDCPQRDERMGWTGDTQVFCNTACYQQNCKDFYRKFMRDMRADQLCLDGQFPQYSPTCKRKRLIKSDAGGAVWADAGTIVPWTVYMHYGDKDLLAENYPAMRDFIEALVRDDIADGGTHLVFSAHTYGDWVAQDGLTPQHCAGGTLEAYIQGVYYYYSTELTAKAAKELGLAEDAEKYGKLAAEIKQALIDEYVTPGGNLSVDTQTGYILALYYGIYRDKNKMISGFKRRLYRDFYSIKCGFCGTPLLLPVLFDCGMNDIAYRILLRETFPGWLYCVKLGATTIWERWNSLDENGKITGTGMNSLNHYAFGSVGEAIYGNIMGLKCAAPGWKKAVIAPCPDIRIGSTSIRLETVSGTWQVDVTLGKDGSITLEACVPEGACAEIRLPDHPDNAVFQVEGGKHTYSYQPSRNYLHPFTEDSILMDILRCPEGKAHLEACLTDWFIADEANTLKAAKDVLRYLKKGVTAEEYLGKIPALSAL